MRAISASALLFLTLAIGCGNVETGGVETTPGGDDDDDGSTANPTPTPGGDTTPGDGTVPESIGGYFVIGNMRSEGNDPPAGLGGSGFFSTQAIPLFWTEPWQTLFDGYPDLPMDSCDWGFGASIAIASDGQVSMSAGDLTLGSSVGSGKFFFLPLGGLQLYIAQSLAGVFDPNGGDYTLSAAGDQVGAFTATIEGPPDVHVTNPALTAATPIVLDRTQDFPMKWEGVKDGLPLYVFLLQAPDENATPQVVVCKLEDDGDGVIPASAMQMFAEPGWGAVQRLQVMKYRLSMFDAPGASGPMILNFASGYDLPATF